MSKFVAESLRPIRAAVVRTPGGPFLIEDVWLGRPEPEEVTVRIVSVGLCHTDLIARDQDYPVPLPAVLGHEGSGIVEEVGSAVSGLAVGDRVVLTFLSCGHCKLCDRGEPAYCTSLFGLNFGGGRLDGGVSTTDKSGSIHDHFFGQSSFGTYATANQRNCIKLQDDDPIDIAGPLGCGIQTGAGAIINSLAVKPGSSVAIFGAGAVGLSAVLGARLAEAGTIIVSDPVASRRALALELGATHAIDPTKEDGVARIQEITGGGADYTLETSGRPDVLRLAIDSLGIRGACGVVGASKLGTEASFDVNTHLVMGRTIRGIVEGDSQPHSFIPWLMKKHREGLFPFDRLVTFYPFDQIETAIADSLGGRTIKAVLRMD